MGIGPLSPLANKCKLRLLNQGISCQEVPPSSPGPGGALSGPCWPLPNFCRLLQAIFFGGIDVSIRGEVWPFLLRYYSHESTSEEREALRAQKRKEYAEIQQKR